MFTFLGTLLFTVMFIVSAVEDGYSNPTQSTELINVDPKGTFLYVDEVYDIKCDPKRVSLAEMSLDPERPLKPGDFIGFKVEGTFVYGSDPIYLDISKNLIAVFVKSDGSPIMPGSKSLVVLEPTLPTWPRGLPTDILQDFFITDDFTIAQIPEEAVAILFAVPDVIYRDNSDPNGDFGVRIYPYPVKFEVLDPEGLLVEPSLEGDEDSPTGGLHVAPTNFAGSPLKGLKSCGFDPGSPKLEFTLRCAIEGRTQWPNFVDCDFKAELEALSGSGGHKHIEHDATRPRGEFTPSSTDTVEPKGEPKGPGGQPENAILKGAMGGPQERKITYNAPRVGGTVRLKLSGWNRDKDEELKGIAKKTWDINVAVRDHGVIYLTEVPRAGDGFESAGEESIGHGVEYRYATLETARKFTELPGQVREALRKQKIFIAEDLPNQEFPGITIYDFSAQNGQVVFTGGIGSVATVEPVKIRNLTTGNEVTAQPDSFGSFTATINAQPNTNDEPPGDLLSFSALRADPSPNPRFYFRVMADGITLVYTSIALPRGGTFDVDSNPEDGEIDSPWSNPHKEHVCGTQVDMRIKNIPRYLRTTLGGVIRKHAFAMDVGWESPEAPNASHWHLQYQETPNNSCPFC